MDFEDIRLSADGASRTGLWTASPALPYFAGHFPGAPVLPAAIILEVSQAFLRAAYGDPALTVARARNCKFRAPVTPGAVFLLQATIEPGGWQLAWTLAGAPVAELSLSSHPPVP